jgi:hypothetical protein
MVKRARRDRCYRGHTEDAERSANVGQMHMYQNDEGIVHGRTEETDDGRRLSDAVHA